MAAVVQEQGALAQTSTAEGESDAEKAPSAGPGGVPLSSMLDFSLGDTPPVGGEDEDEVDEAGGSGGSGGGGAPSGSGGTGDGNATQSPSFIGGTGKDKTKQKGGAGDDELVAKDGASTAEAATTPEGGLDAEKALGETSDKVEGDTGSDKVAAQDVPVTLATPAPEKQDATGSGPAEPKVESKVEEEKPADPALGATVAPAAAPEPLALEPPPIAAPVLDDEIALLAWQQGTGTDPEDMASYAESKLAELSAMAAANEAEVMSHGAGLAASVDGEVASRVAAVTGAFDGAVSTVQAHFGALRGEIDSTVGAAVSAVEASLASALGTIDAGVAARVGEVGAAFDTALDSLDGIREESLAEATAEWDGRVQAIRAGGQERAEAAMAAARGLAAGWTGGDGIEKERNDARRKAALETGQKYAKEILDKSKMAADDLAEAGSGIGPAMADTIQQFVDPTLQAKADAIQVLEDTGATARSEAEGQAAASASGIRDAGEAAKEQLSAKERTAVEALEKGRDEVVAGFEAAGEETRGDLQAASEALAATYGAFMEELRATLVTDDIPNEGDVDAAVAEAVAILDTCKAEQLAALTGSFGEFTAKLDETAASAIAAANANRDQILVDSTAMATEMKASIAEIGQRHASGLTEFASGVNEKLGEMAAASVQAASDVTDQARQALQNVKGQLLENLDTSKDQVLADLDSAVRATTSEGQRVASKAASDIKEKSWWEKAWDVVASVVSTIVTVLATVIVFVAVAAFVVATFGTGLVALIAAGAIAGGLAAVIGGFLGDATKALLLWDSSQIKSGREYVQSFVVGAATGAFFFPAAAASGFAAVGFGIAGAWSGSLADQLTDISLLGQEWNTQEFLVSGILGSVLVFGGQYVSKAIPKSWGRFFQNKVFPNKIGDWNQFQTFCKNSPGLKNLSNQQRAELWKQMVRDPMRGAPQDIILNATVEQIKDHAGDTLQLSDHRDQQKAAVRDTKIDSKIK